MPAETCHKHISPNEAPSFFQNGDAVFQTYHVGWIISGVFTAVAIAVSFWLIDKHLVWYTNKREQRYIVRLLFLVPIYAVISFASFLFWNQSTPLILVRDAYEAIVLTSFFYLLLNYLSPDPEEQKRIFLKAGISKVNDAARRQKGEKLQKWMWPLGPVKKKPKDGLYFLQLMKWAILQYCVIRPVTTLIAVILDYNGLYCESSWAPGWGHLWIILIISISVTIAMYCLIQVYMPVAKQLAPHRPILKLFAVKAVVFLTFWQSTFLALLTLMGVVKDGKYMTAEDITIGIRAILETFEMMLFAFLHVKAFSYRPYRPFYHPDSKDPPPMKTRRLRSLGNVLDFRETFREIWVGCIYLFDKMRGREPTPDFNVRRAAHYEEAFGRARPQPPPPMQKEKKGQTAQKEQSKPGEPMDITINQQVEVDVAGERQWLGVGDDYGYGLGYFRRERSEVLSVQIEKELQKRGYSSGDSVQANHGTVNEPPPPPPAPPKPAKGRRSSSWWRNLYDRISGQDEERHEPAYTQAPSSPRKLQSKSRPTRPMEHQHERLQDMEYDLSDPPPESVLRPATYQVPEIQFTPTPHRPRPKADQDDVLSPLSVYRERRRSYRPRRTRGDSSSALLGSPPASPPTSPTVREYPREREYEREYQPDNAAELGMLSSQDRLGVPSAPNNRSDSLLNRLFPPSESGSLNDLTRENGSAYSLSQDDHQVHNHQGPQLPSIASVSGRFESSAPLLGMSGDKRLTVQEKVIHPSKSTTDMLVPWSADIVGLHSQTSLNDAPPPPEKDFLAPPPRGSHRRESAHFLNTNNPLPPLPPGAQYIPPRTDAHSNHRIPLSSPASSSFSSQTAFSVPAPRSPPVSHSSAIRRVTLVPKADSSSSSRPSSKRLSRSGPIPTNPYYVEPYELPIAPEQSQRSPPPPRSARDGDPSRGRNREGGAERIRPPSVGSADFSDVSVATYYTAISYPSEQHQHSRR